jgi:hypothetical protein
VALSPEQLELKLLRTLLTRVYAPQALDDPRFSAYARAGLLRMMTGSFKQRHGALALISAVKSGMLSGILSEEADATSNGALPPGETIRLTGSIGSSPAPRLLHRSSISDTEHGVDGALSQAVDLLNGELRSRPVSDLGTTPLASISCMVYCGLCAAALVDDGITAPACLVCLTCATDA